VFVAIASLLLVLAVGIADYATGSEFRIYPLYFVPIAWAAWSVTRGMGLGLAAFSSASWLVANYLDGKVLNLEVWVVNVLAQTIAFAAIALLVGEVRHRLDRERDAARTDPLTTLPNSRGFYERAELLLSLARRSGRPTTFAFLDLDNFKAVNDEHGHQVGDAALRKVADVLRQQTRESDVTARVGGDEFALLLPDTTAEAAVAMLDRVRLALQTEMQANRWPITASIGALVFPRPPDSIDAALHDADALMYRVKQDGKNRVRLATAGQPESAAPVPLAIEAHA
jgi:diguanylate cyclase (GGDEF)-like protein